jgi:thiol-disulfide isomerase/thioredoxin
MQRVPLSKNSINRRSFIAMTLLAGSGPVAAQITAPGGTSVPDLEGTSADGKRLRLVDFRGRVVLVFYWATGCAVCRDKMRELRANLMGWQSQPFTLLGVNMDMRRQDWLDYERLVAQSIPAGQRFDSVWAGGSDFRDTMGRPTQLPSACVIDKNGILVEQYRGRVPVEAWNRIADLI